MAIGPLLRKALAEVLLEHCGDVSQKAWAKASGISEKAFSDYVKEISFAGPENFGRLAVKVFREPPEHLAVRIIERLHSISHRGLTTSEKGEVTLQLGDRLREQKLPLSTAANELAQTAIDPDEWASGRAATGGPESLTVASRRLADAFLGFVDAVDARLDVDLRAGTKDR